MANNGQIEYEQRDENPHSATFGQLRWVPGGANAGLCPLPNTNATWEPTGVTRCEKVEDKNTGYVELQQRDTNQYSSTYNSLRWVYGSYNVATCPLPQAGPVAAGKVSTDFYMYLSDACNAPAMHFLYTEDGSMNEGQKVWLRENDTVFKEAPSNSVWYIRIVHEGTMEQDSLVEVWNGRILSTGSTCF